ncbi:hypothetical protein C4571_01620, partial [Candidatus Parcubacteria bacterium]
TASGYIQGGGGLTITSGVTALQSLTFTNATGTELALTGTGTALQVISGNVGIGTSTPATQLHIYATSSPPIITLENGTTTGRKYQFRVGAVNTSNTLDIFDASSSVSVLTFTPSGANGVLLGINTSTPAAYLDLRGTNSGLDFIQVTRNSGDVLLSMDDVGLTTFQPSGDNTAAYQWKEAGGLVVMSMDTTNERVLVGTGTTATTRFLVSGKAGSGDDLIRIVSSSGSTFLKVDVRGNVGIGTALPLSLFSVAGLPPQTSTSTLVLLGSNFITGGNASGTFIGINPTSTFNGDFLNFQVNSSTKFSVSGAGVASTTELRSPSSTIGNLFFTNASGTRISASTGFDGGRIDVSNATITTAFTLSFLSGGSTKCLTVDAGGNVTSTGAACGSGGVEAGWRTNDPFVYLTTSTNSVGIGATSTNVKLYVQSTAVGSTTLMLQGATNQTADLFQAASSSGQIYFQIGALGIASSTEFRTPSSTITALTTTNVSSTNLTASGYLQVAGVSALQGMTFTNATGTGNLQVATLRTTGNATLDGRLAIGTTTFTGSISIQSSTAAATGVAGIFEDLLIDTTVGGTFQFGDRQLVKVSSTASTTAIGTFIRMTDDTSLANNVQGLQVQAYSGSNNQGVNTGILSFGRTFGIQGITTGEAGGVAEPAGVYAELQNGTQGNALRAYSATSTTATLVQFFQESSAFSGSGLLMNFGNSGGSFTGNFMNLQRGAITKFAVNATGTLVVGTSTAAIATSTMLVVCAQTNCTLPVTTSTVMQIASVDGTTGTTSILARGAITGNSSDYGEYVPVEGSVDDYEEGDLLAISTSTYSSTTPSIAVFKKAEGPYDPNLAGAVTKHAAFIAGMEDIEGKVVIALVGRIPVKVSGENGSIEPGDRIAASTLPGHGMKATGSGMVLGVALQAFDGADASSTGSIVVFINPHWYTPQISITDLQGGSDGTGLTLNTYSFDPKTIYSFENLKVQNLEIGSEERPSGITIFDVKTNAPYCVIVEHGVLKAVPGKCGEGLTQNLIQRLGAPPENSDGSTQSTAIISETIMSPPPPQNEPPPAPPEPQAENEEPAAEESVTNEGETIAQDEPSAEPPATEATSTEPVATSTPPADTSTSSEPDSTSATEPAPTDTTTETSSPPPDTSTPPAPTDQTTSETADQPPPATPDSSSEVSQPPPPAPDPSAAPPGDPSSSGQ